MPAAPSQDRLLQPQPSPRNGPQQQSVSRVGHRIFGVIPTDINHRSISIGGVLSKIGRQSTSLVQAPACRRVVVAVKDTTCRLQRDTHLLANVTLSTSRARNSAAPSSDPWPDVHRRAVLVGQTWVARLGKQTNKRPDGRRPSKQKLPTESTYTRACNDACLQLLVGAS